MIELNLKQGSSEWLLARAKCFTASEAPAMMGVSNYMSRTELLRQKATGQVREHDQATLARCRAGHDAEDAARPIVEGIIGEPLYPIVATDDSGKFLASSDGATMLLDVGFEHKIWNEKLADQVRSGIVPDSHAWQLDHQCMVFGFKKIIFVVSDGTSEKMVWCWYQTTPERIARLMAGWRQFEQDVANYRPDEIKPEIVPQAIEDLPALSVQLSGQVVASNLVTFESIVRCRIKAISTDLVTDEDFVNADKMAKFLGDGEKRLEVVKAQALAQTESIDQLFRTIDSLKEEMRQKRLSLEKLVKAEKENRKAEIVNAARAEFSEYCQGLYQKTGVRFEVASPMIFGEATKSLKLLSAMQDKVSAALAAAKADADITAAVIEKNRALVEDESLVPDFSQVCTKSPDDFAALLALRKQQRTEAEARRLEQERERIRAEEEAKAIAKARQEERERRDAEDAARRAQEAAERQAKELETSAAKAVEQAAPKATEVTQAAPSTDAEESKLIKLGDMSSRLGFVVTADFLATLGFQPAKQDRASKLYRADQFPTICRKISEHVMAQAWKDFE